VGLCDDALPSDTRALAAPEEVTPWVNDLLARFNTLLPLFVTSAEFQSLVPDCRDPTIAMALVTRLYQQVLSRTPSQDEVGPWTNYIVATCDLEGTIRLFFNSSEYLSVARTLDQHVTILYRALLAREPDASGLQSFVTSLAGQLAVIEDAFISSMEFQVRFQSLFQ
jgi:Domain of unknown function (DUF4214)